LPEYLAAVPMQGSDASVKTGKNEIGEVHGKKVTA
jgi:hypothetical protein